MDSLQLLRLILLVGAVLANVIMAFFVYKNNSKSATNILFGLLSLIISVWLVINYISLHPYFFAASLFWIRSTIFIAMPMSTMFFLLAHTLPRTQLQFSRKVLFVISIVTFSVMIINISPYAFTAVEMINDSPQPVAGLGLLPFIILSTLFSLFSIFTLFRKLKTATGRVKAQLSFVMLGIALMLGLIIVTVLLPVVLFKINFFVSFIPVYTLLFLASVAYTIVRHRLMDIRAAVARSLSFSALIGGVLLIYGALVVFVVPIVVDITGINSNIAAVTVALISIPVAKYIQKILRRVTDRFLFQKRINYPAELVKASQELSGTIDINDVTKTIIDTTREIIRARKTIIFLKKSGSEVFSPIALHGIKNIKVTIPASHYLIEHIQKSQKLIIKDELAFEREQEVSERHAEELKKVEESLVWLDATVVLPLFVNKELSGIILLGNKKSGEPYLQDDIEFLSSFAPQAAVALQNAYLYQESLEFGEKLEMEIKRATSELSVANEQLRDLDKAKSEFLSIASHQLYTPLTALRGYLSMIREGDYGVVNKKQKPIIDILEKSANRLIALIKNLLDISRIESGKLELDLESTDLVEIVDSLVMELMPNAITKQLDLKFVKRKKPMPRVVADSMRIRQVLLNFIDNAIKYTMKGKIEVTVVQEDSELVFSVTDTGQGLTRDGITRLFNKFTRIGGDTRFRTEGTGLGLYLAKQIVKEHHGDVEVTSPGLGEGSTFSMRVPIEGSPNSLKAGEKLSVDIKAAEAEG